jgi:CheY-like chemotaxis protein
VCDDRPVAGTVLVVDDHPSFRRAARRMLEAAGFAVDEAADGAAALAAVREHRPDVVLLDVLLPDRTGFELAEVLAARPAGPCVVLTSSRSAADFRVSLARSSARGFITKSELTGPALAALLDAAP